MFSIGMESGKGCHSKVVAVILTGPRRLAEMALRLQIGCRQGFEVSRGRWNGGCSGQCRSGPTAISGSSTAVSRFLVETTKRSTPAASTVFTVTSLLPWHLTLQS
jgi:hypothetical protein